MRPSAPQEPPPGGPQGSPRCLRGSITSLPPLFPELSSSLHLSPAAIAALAATPVLCFGVFSGVAAPLSRRYGEERVLLVALALYLFRIYVQDRQPAVQVAKS